MLNNKKLNKHSSWEHQPRPQALPVSGLKPNPLKLAIGNFRWSALWRGADVETLFHLPFINHDYANEPLLNVIIWRWQQLELGHLAPNSKVLKRIISDDFMHASSAATPFSELMDAQRSVVSECFFFFGCARNAKDYAVLPEEHTCLLQAFPPNWKTLNFRVLLIGLADQNLLCNLVACLLESR